MIISAIRKVLTLSFSLSLAVGILSCGSKASTKDDQTMITIEQTGSWTMFSPDSAFNYVKRQLDFGPRVPGTASHDSCAAWIAAEASLWMDTVILQKGTVKAFNGSTLPITNIFGQIAPEKNNRILLLAHYDTRPWADAEDDRSMIDKPIPGANDGASGVAVLLEIARVLNHESPGVGVDFLFTDAEDYGAPQHLALEGVDAEDSWCLGTQYWAQNRGSYNPMLAVLLDMVGGKGAQFHKEYFSELYAGDMNKMLWTTAEKIGYGNYFVNETGNPITDDHIYLLQAGIPAVDIIENKNPLTGSFNPTWHTHNDNIENIDPATLQAVGATVLEFINQF